MKLTRFSFPALLLGTAVVAASCGDFSPVAPLPPPTPVVQAGLLGDLLNTVNGVVRGTGLLACTPLQAATSSQTVGPAGGTINIGPHKLVIPAGALSRNVTIKATLKREPINRVQFLPDGLEFNKQATLTMSYANCGLLNSLIPKRIVYTSPNLQILERLLSLDDLLGNKVSAKLSHFSDYAIEELSFSDHAAWW